MNQTEEESNCSTSMATLSSDDPNPCPICLGLVHRDAFLDRCFHRYCYECILRWTRVASARTSSAHSSSVECPLCKTVNFSFIYGYVENKSQPDQSIFQRHYIGEDGRKRKYLQMSRWLQSWLMREIQALIQEEDVDIILHHIPGVIESFSRSNEKRGPIQVPELKQAAFKAMVEDAARPFLMARTDRFVHELELFLASGLTVDVYDRVYKKKLGWPAPEETSERNEHTADDTNHIQTCPYSYLFEESSDEAD